MINLISILVKLNKMCAEQIKNINSCESIKIDWHIDVNAMLCIAWVIIFFHNIWFLLENIYILEVSAKTWPWLLSAMFHNLVHFQALSLHHSHSLQPSEISVDLYFTSWQHFQYSSDLLPLPVLYQRVSTQICSDSWIAIQLIE